ncbi:stage III sporulation protein AD [Clostridium sp. USBA 49]|jgi:stage III sporulation protein AD|uniref:stage III sporulation protein AD n=1 Tax=Clostridium TaxID=1485 RepID=UPI00099910AB|nr:MULTISPECIES: stage III sporulation protein AD [Clostridium]SKA76819.1 stage III sporulation protein AD [Clostridium sp. USBA 49]
MDIVKVVAFAFMALTIVFILRKENGTLAIQVSTVAGIIIFLFTISKITAVLQLIQQLALKANIDYVYINTVFKILAIAYLASFCAEICRDAGESNIASKVEFAGKIFILVLAIPILMAVLQSILKII